MYKRSVLLVLEFLSLKPSLITVDLSGTLSLTEPLPLSVRVLNLVFCSVIILLSDMSGRAPLYKKYVKVLHYHCHFYKKIIIS